jgi:hypothetical protein
MSELEPYPMFRPDDGLNWFDRMQVNGARRRARVEYLADEPFATADAAKKAVRHRNASKLVEQDIKDLCRLYFEAKKDGRGDQALELLLFSMVEELAMEFGDDIDVAPIRRRAING